MIVSYSIFFLHSFTVYFGTGGGCWVCTELECCDTASEFLRIASGGRMGGASFALEGAADFLAVAASGVPGLLLATGERSFDGSSVETVRTELEATKGFRITLSARLGGIAR